MRFRLRRGLNFHRNRRRVDKTTVKKGVSWAVEIIIVIILAFTLVHFWGMRVTVAESSMDPTLHQSDKVLLNRLVYQIKSPESGDLIAFYPNGNERSRIYIKRVIGVPGDKVQIRDGTVYVNDKAFKGADTESVEEAGLAEDVITLGEDEYFVLGDNSDNSEDSRYASIGNVNKNDIIGKVWFRIRPISSMGRVE